VLKLLSFIVRLSVFASVTLTTSLASAETLSGRVVSITDGDTVILLDKTHQQYKIRLAAIDAPEKAQPFGQKSKTNLSALIFNKDITAVCSKRDRYGRLICKVLLGVSDVNLEQIKAGMAWHYRKYAKEQTSQDRENYEIAEFNAKLRRLGLWNDKNPIPPWDWRKH